MGDRERNKKRLLELLQAAGTGNAHCADCGAAARTRPRAQAPDRRIPSARFRKPPKVSPESNPAVAESLVTQPPHLQLPAEPCGAPPAPSSRFPLSPVTSTSRRLRLFSRTLDSLLDPHPGRCAAAGGLTRRCQAGRLVRPSWEKGRPACPSAPSPALVSSPRFRLSSSPASPAADPDWASYKLGVFICLNCCGVHRNFPDISKVKSVRLDFWDDSIVEFMTRNGNLHVKAKFEARVPAFYYIPQANDCLTKTGGPWSPLVLPALILGLRLSTFMVGQAVLLDDLVLKEQWIRAKYERREFMADGETISLPVTSIIRQVTKPQQLL
ncbi:hypothetical protein P7K49_011185 [Saguinus oedipus]|uniref:Arf-GAP domain-containing protein n=1 Tax=Saguinus oedipus TaxID=9490 RepID=A0ABQ9VPY4_SAGOE|nr:hypothetical protein P7K49_011185 [Saguinus oedipus]